MSKMYSCLFQLCIALCAALLCSINIFGQSDDLKTDLNDSFRKFDLVRIETGETLRPTGGQQRLRIAAAGKNFELDLIPYDLRSPRYRAEATAAAGRVRALKKGEVTTYKGSIAGEFGSQVRMTIDGEQIEGFFVSGGERYFIEPANRHSALASKSDFVVYKQGDSLNDEGFACFSETEEKIESGKDYVLSTGIEDLTGLRAIEIATEADYQYVSATGGSAQTNNEILSILNMVEGMYENEIGMTISVVYQHTWETPDPFDGSNAGNLLISFKNHWNANFPVTQYPRDTAHLWSAKANVLNQGFAYVGVVCNTGSAYGISGRIQWQQAKYLISGHEIGHNLGAHHAETAQSCANTLMNATLSVVTPLTFCSFSRTEISGFVTPNGGCLQPPNTASTRFDFDGDGRSDIGVFRPANGTWYINKSASGFNAFQFGLFGDKPVSADYDGDGKADAAVYRGGIWYILRSSDAAFQAVGFGLPHDVPAPADFDGDGRSDIAVFRPADGTWHRLNSGNGAYSSVQFGLNGDVPLSGDYDGDGRADINLFRPSSGTWYRLNSSSGAFFAAQFGIPEDKALSGDFDGDGKYDLAVWRPSNGVWYILKSSTGAFQAAQFGLAGDTPTPADFDGDGKTDIAVFRPNGGVWYRLNSSNGAFAAMQFGIETDLAVHSYYVR